MLTWMLFSTAIGALLAAAAMLAEPLARQARLSTRFLWLLVVVATIGWSAVVAVGEPRAPTRYVSERGATTSNGMAVSVSDGAAGAIIRDTATLAGRMASTVLPRQSIQVDVVLLVLWLLGSVACVAILVFSAWRIARMRRGWTPRVVAGVPVLVSHDVGPAVIGVVHHGVVLPAWIESLDEAAQRLVMIHEREHVRAGDPLLLWSTTLLVSLMPWNVALWFALRRMRHAIEIDCDARVLQLAPDPHPYCSLLIDVGARSLTGVAPVAALAEPATLLERRVTAMLSSRSLGYREVMGGVLAMGLIVVACRTPRPAGLASIGVPQLAQELTARLGTESGKAALSPDDRILLGEALGYSFVPPQASMNSISPALLAEVDSSDTRDRGAVIDSLIETYYPSLTTGADTAPTLLGIVFVTRDGAGYSPVPARHGVRRGGSRGGDIATLLRQMGLDTVSGRTGALGAARRFGGRVGVVFANERAGPVRGVTTLRAALPPADGPSGTADMTMLVRGLPGQYRSMTLFGSNSSRRRASGVAPTHAEVAKQDSVRPLPDSVVRKAVAKYFPRALTGGLGHHPYLWFAADRDDRVLRAAEGRQGLRSLIVGGGNRAPTPQLKNLISWEGAQSMLPGVPGSSQPGDAMLGQQFRVGEDTITVVWLRLQAGLR